MDFKLKDSFMNASIRNIDEENHRITHTINTKALDRYSSVILPKGARVVNFLKNAVVLWAHNRGITTPKIPIGKCIELNIEEDAVVVTTEFYAKDELAMKVFNAYKDGFLHAWSIGFDAIKYKCVDEENVVDINKKYGTKISKEDLDDAKWGVYLVYDWDLLEYSAVPVPGNPEALSADDTGSFKRELVTRGLLEKATVEEINFNTVLERESPEESEAIEDKPEAETKVKEAVKKEVEGEDTEVNEEVVDDGEDEVVLKKAKDAEESQEDTVSVVEKESKEEVEESEDNEKDKEDPEKTSDPIEKVPEVEEESEAETKAMIDAAQREAKKTEQGDVQNVKFEELTEAVRSLTEKLEAVGSLGEKVTELLDKVSKLEAKSSEVEAIKRDFKQIVEELGTENIDAIRKIEAEKTNKGDRNSSDGFWHNLLLNR